MALPAPVVASLDPGATTSGLVGGVVDCFARDGTAISVFEAICLVAGAGGCAARCSVSADAACLSCIGVAGLSCSLGTAVGNIGLCLASALFGAGPPPTAPRTPTNTRTRTPLPSTPAPSRPGDCDGDGRVSIAELIYGVGIALGENEASGCPAIDQNDDGRVDIGELVRAVRAALA